MDRDLRKDSYIKVGMRVKLIDMLNDPAPIPKGTEGTVDSVNDLGQMGQVIGVKWDNGRNLNMIPGVDSYEILETTSRDGMFREGDVSVKMGDQSKSSKRYSKETKSTYGASGRDIQFESDIKKVMSVKSIAKKHGVSVEEIEKEIKIGTKIELEHTDDKKTARKIATHHVEEHHDHYSNKEHGLVANEKELEEDYAGSVVGPLGGQPIRRNVYGESYTIKVKDLMEVTVSSTKLRDDGSFDGSAWVGDKDNDGWNFNDKPTFHEDGEIVDILAKMDINWKDEDLTVVTKESVMESVSKVMGEEKKVLIDEGVIDKITTAITNVKGFIKNQRESIKKLYELKRKVNSAHKEGRITKEKYLEYNEEISGKSKVLVANIIKIVGPVSIPTGLIIRTLIFTLAKTPIGKKMGVDKLDKLLSPKELDIRIDDLNLDFGTEKLTSNDVSKNNQEVTQKPEGDKEEDVTTETSTTGSVMGDSGNGMPVGKTFASTGESSSAGKKPTWAGGKIVQSIPNEGVLMPESFTLAEINKIKYMEGGKYVKLKNKCVKYRNQPFCSSGDADKPVVLSDRTSDNVDEVSRKTGLSKEEIFEALLVKR